MSCTAAATTACTAVGNANGLTVAEQWNGTTWALQPTPIPAYGSGLFAVSCTAAAACTAVGQSNGPTLAERWNGTSWAVQLTPTPAGPANRALSGVSCTTATTCIAVGDYTNASGTQVTLAEAWDGSSWALQTTPNPPGLASSTLSSVSCTTATDCSAVGYSFTSAHAQLPLAEQWDGTTWAVQTTPNPSGAGVLSGVACTATTVCTAVGHSVNSTGGTGVPLAEQWNGKLWTVQPTPTPTGTPDSTLLGVSCTAATACTAVGYYNSSGTNVPLAERWDGNAWALQPVPNPNPSGVLSAVSCTAATACTAIGDYIDEGGTLAEQWNGSSWAIQPTPNPTGSVLSSLSSVSCTAVTTCTAVGSSFNGSGPYTILAEQWNGTAWAVQPTPNPPNPVDAYLLAVSCTAASACSAGGYYQDQSNIDETLAERYSG